MSLEIFPELTSMAWNNEKIQRWDGVYVQKSGNGRRKSLCTQPYPEWELQCSYKCLDQEQIRKAAGFFAMVRGKHQPFLWKDTEDFSQTKVRIGNGDGTKTGWQLVRNFGGYFVEPVRDIVSGTLHLYADAAEIACSLGSDGWVTPNVAPAQGAVITASFEYYWRVAFKDSELTWDNFWYNFFELKTISMVTVW